jgi:hypothetical protein
VLTASSDGSSITIEDQALFSTIPALGTFRDEWRIAGGIGRYAGLQGEGTGTLAAGELILVGEVHYL